MSDDTRMNADESDANDDAPEQSMGQVIWEQVGTLVIAVAIALTIRAFVIEPFRIPSGSMLPTLLVGDHLFVNKFIYGAKIPFTDIRLPALREPERGDVVVFSVARQGSQIIPADKRPELRRDDFVKRVVGLPGDRVEVRAGGHVYINGERIAIEETDAVFIDRGEYGERQLDIGIEQLGDCTHLMLDDPHVRGVPQQGFTVPAGRYFMLGDNRDYSRDSRAWGTVRLEEMKGPAFILYWSWEVNGNFLSFLNPVNWWQAEKRWERVGSRVRCEKEPDLDAAASAS